MGFLLPLLATVGKQVGKAAGKSVLNNIAGGGQQQDQGPQIQAPPQQKPMPQTATPDLLAPYRGGPTQPGSMFDPTMPFQPGGAPSASPGMMGVAPETNPQPLAGAAPPSPQLPQQSQPNMKQRMLGVLQNFLPGSRY